MPCHASAGRPLLPRTSLEPAHCLLEPVRRLRDRGRNAMAVVAFMALGADAVHAQAPAAVVSPPAPSGEMSAAERAKRDADKVFHWIMIHSDKPRKAKGEPKSEPKPEARPEAKADARRDDKDKPVAAPVATAARPARAEAAAAPAPKGGEPAKADAAAAATTVAAPHKLPAAGELAKTSNADAASRQVASVPPTPAAAPADDDEDIALVPVRQTEPEFPASVMRQLRKGLVQVRFDVQADGTVAKAEVVKTTHRRLNDTAIDAVSQWRFQPVRKTQTAVVELGFNLD